MEGEVCSLATLAERPRTLWASKEQLWGLFRAAQLCFPQAVSSLGTVKDPT